ncbi:hypothetical protein A3Q56_08020 [Intoshia linei]|uniref:Uncharacterized protein n=1 Tax=Intoshia linei TaxID=1819745 RepID=A0A177AQL1_9BILA|nr:hypothetical protein A3Q56_08020 [Intoshia linei]
MTDNNCFEIGPLLEYNSLLDPYLKNYFTKPRMRHHLVKAGLINKSGFIISEENCKKVNSKKQKHKFVQDSLAQLIVNETVSFDLKRQKEIKDKLIEISNIENVIKIRNERKLEKRDYLFEFLESIHIKNKKVNDWKNFFSVTSAG